MAGINRVEFGDTVILDLTGTTVAPDNLLSGVTAYDRNGDLITGTYSGGSSANIIDDDTGSGVFDKTWSADKIYKRFRQIQENIDNIDVDASSIIDDRVTYATNKTWSASRLNYLFTGIDERIDSVEGSITYDVEGTVRPLGELAFLNTLDYKSNLLINKPVLGKLAPLDSIDYESNYLTNKPNFGRFAFYDTLDYNSKYLINKPKLGALSQLDQLDYKSNLLINKPESISEVIDRIYKICPYIPFGIILAVYLSDEILFMIDRYASYSNEVVEFTSYEETDFSYTPESMIIDISESFSFAVPSGGSSGSESSGEGMLINVIPEAPKDGNAYVRVDGQWVALNTVLNS